MDRRTRVGQRALIGSDRVYWGMCVSQGTTEGAGWTCNRNKEGLTVNHENNRH